MLRIDNTVREVVGADWRALPDELLRAREPVVLRGLVADWPLVKCGRASAEEALGYLRHFVRDAEVIAMVAPPQVGGRFFYNEDISGFNFHAERPRLSAVLNALQAQLDTGDAPSLYLGSTTVDT